MSLVLHSAIAYSMPPHQRVLDMIKSGQIGMPDFMQNPDFFKERGIDQGLPHRLAALDNPTGQFRVLAILVEFSDNPNQVSGTYFDNLIYGTTGNTVWSYYDEVSYGNLDIVTVNLPSSTGWQTMPQTYAYYVDGDHGFGTYPHNARKLAEDAVWAANPYVDFSQYDNDNDGEVDALYIIHAGPGAEWTGSVDDIWSHAWSCYNDPNVDGVTVDRYSMEPEYWSSPNDMTCGVYVHEIGHVFGVPDLYDTDYSSRGLGRWSSMAGGSWNGSAGNSPAHFDAWSRAFLGFVTPTNVTGSISNAPFPAVENTPTVYRLWTDGQAGPQFFLAENRQKTGFDSALPQGGILIYHIDENESGNTNEWYPGYTSSGHYKVALEQADGDWDLEQNTSSGDNGDPYPGSSNNRTFNNNSTPDSKSYNFTNTYVAITSISNNGSNMSADLSVSNAPLSPSPLFPLNGSATSNRRPYFDFASSSGATVYHIQIDNNSDFSSPVFDVNTLSFSSFTPSYDLSDNLYYWHVRAGNGSVWSGWSATWTVTVDAVPPGSPADLTANGANPSPWSNNVAFLLEWINPPDLSGLQKALFKLGAAPISVFDTSASFAPDPPQNINIPTQGGIPLYIWLQDNAGNADHSNAVSVVLNLDFTDPTGSSASSPDTSNSTTFTVSWSEGSDAGGSGLAGIYDIYVSDDATNWSLWKNNTPAMSAQYTGVSGFTYYFEALCYDNAGNRETHTESAETSTFIDTSASFLPGDANNSGEVNGLDVIYLVSYLKGEAPPPDPFLAGDSNGSCTVNGLDVIYLVSYFKGGDPPFMGQCP
jgi:immune inhibitor A